MNSNRKRVFAIFFRTESGAVPALEWIKSLDKEDRYKIGDALKTVEFGWPVGMPLCRKMTKGLWEMRVRLTGERNARLLFCIHDNHVVVLHGLIKKSRKTPQVDLDTAWQRKKILESRS